MSTDSIFQCEQKITFRIHICALVKPRFTVSEHISVYFILCLSIFCFLSCLLFSIFFSFSIFIFLSLSLSVSLCALARLLSFFFSFSLFLYTRFPLVLSLLLTITSPSYPPYILYYTRICYTHLACVHVPEKRIANNFIKILFH
uniref:Uncharacterized protein n=1 Tax=Rhipicephalus zambeziensis TaxID=60191 RepID=A0A224YGH3_9ACAR